MEARLIEGRSCSKCGASLYLDSPTDDAGHCERCWEFHHDCRCLIENSRPLSKAAAT